MGHYLTIKISSSQNHGPKLFCRSGGGKRLKLLAPLLALLYSSQQSWILIFQIFIFIRLCPSSIPFSFKYPLAAFIVQLLSRVWLLVTPWTAAHLCPLSYAISREFTQTHVHWVRDAIQLSHPLSLPSSPAFNLSQDHDLFQLIDSLLVPTFSISPSNDYSGLISFLIDWFDLLAVWGTRESSPAPQFKSINSWMLSLLYDLTLTSVYDYWKNHSSDNGTWLWIGYLLTEMLEGQDTGRKSHGTTGFSFPILSPFHKWSSLLWFIIKRIVF